MPDIPTIEPDLIYAGETVQWTRSFPDFPATEYTLKYYLIGPASVTLTAAAYNTTDYKVTISAATSGAYTYGIYSWVAYAEKGAAETLEKYRIGTGFLTIKTAAGKSHAKKMLDALDALIEGRGTNSDLDIVRMSIAGREIDKKPEELRKWRNYYRDEYQSELSKENGQQGKATGSRILVKFKRPS